MEIFKIVQTLQSCSTDFIAYKMGSEFAYAVEEAVALMIQQGEQIAQLEERLGAERKG